MADHLSLMCERCLGQGFNLCKRQLGICGRTGTHSHICEPCYGTGSSLRQPRSSSAAIGTPDEQDLEVDALKARVAELEHEVARLKEAKQREGNP